MRSPRETESRRRRDENLSTLIPSWFSVAAATCLADGRSRRLKLVRLRNGVQEFLTVPLELHRSDAANITESRKRSRPLERQFGEGPITEYNIGRNLFLTRD